MSDPHTSGAAAGIPSYVANPEVLRELLNRLAYLKEATSEDELGYYLHGVEEIRLPAGAMLYSQGGRVDRIFLLLEGQVSEVRLRAGNGDGSGGSTPPGPAALATGDEPLLRESQPGALLGLYDLIYHKPHTSAARAAGDCVLIAVDAAQVGRLLYRYPELRNSMLPAARIDRLRTMPLLAAVDDVAIAYLADAALFRTCASGERIIETGALPDSVILIDEGQVRLDFDDGRSLWLGNGGDFGYGERLQPAAATTPEPLTYNAVAESGARLLVVPRAAYVAATGRPPEADGLRLRALRAQALEEIGVFGAWSPADRARLLGFMSHYYIPNSHLLTQQGEVADSLWVLLPGSRAVVHALKITGEALPEMQLEGPGYFNEAALRAQSLATGTLEAEPRSQWLRLHWQDFRAFLDQTGRKELAAQLRLTRQAEPTGHDEAHDRYSWLAQGERLILEVRRHWIVALAKMSPAVLVSIFFGWLIFGMVAFGYSNLLLRLAAVLLGVLAVGWWIWAIVDYRNDFLIITNLRVVRQEKVVLFRESRQIAPLEKVQEVNFRQDFWGTKLGFADLDVQTAAARGNIRFDRVARFENVATLIRQERDARRRHYQATGKRMIYKELENRFGGALVLPSRVWMRPTPPPAPPPSSSRAALAWLNRLTARPGGRYNPLIDQPPKPPNPNDNSVDRGGERYVWHKHWFVLLRVMIGPLLLLTAAAVLAVFFSADYQGGMQGSLITVATFMGFGALAWLWWNVEDWRNDIYVLDRDTLVDIERKPLGLRNDQRTASLSQIVDIQLRVPTPLHYLLNFGHVIVQTAAQEGQFTFLEVPDPGGVVEIIRTRLDQSRQAEEQRAAKLRAQEFPDWLEVYSRLDPNREDR